MQSTSELYKELLNSPNHYAETSLVIGESGALITTQGEYITFGGFHILVDSGGPEDGYREEMIFSLETTSMLFSDDEPEVGCCVGAELVAEILEPNGEIQRMARIVPYIRLTDGVRKSEWIQKGVFWLDTREENVGDQQIDTIKLVGYDTIRKADVELPVDGIDWPSTDIEVVEHIARIMGVSVDARTRLIMTNGYQVLMPTDYTCREVLAFLAAGYGGSFVMSDAGQLRLIQLTELPPETNLLCTSGSIRYTITIGEGVRILV